MKKTDLEIIEPEIESIKKEDKLGTQKVSKLLFSLAMPAVIGQIISLLYNIVDRMYIGHLPDIGGLALTGVGVTLPLTLIISAFSALVGMGGAPRAAIKMGEKNNKAASQILGNCTSLLLILSVVLTVVFLVFAKPLLMMFGASEATLPYAMEYMRIYTLGTVFVQVTLGLNPFISTQGFSTTSMFTVLIGAIINIVLDPILMFGFGMGVSGAALATIISQGVSAVWVLKFLSGKKTRLRLQKKNLKLRAKTILPVLALGVSPFVMQATESIINIAFNARLQLYGGDVAVGVMTILASAMQFVFLPLMGITQGAQPIISYNYGAGNIKRVGKAFKLMLLVNVAYTLLFWAFLMFAPQMFVSMFTSDAQIVEMGTWALRVYMGASLLLGVQVSCQQTFIAVGNSKISLFLALLRKIFLLLPLIYILPNVMDNKVFGVFFAQPVADVFAVATTATMFIIYFKKLMKQGRKKEDTRMKV